MATKTWTLDQINVGGTNPNRLWWDEDKVIPAAATSLSGWTVNKTAAGNYGALSSGLESSTFSTTIVPNNTAPTAEISYVSIATYSPPRLFNSSDSIATFYPYNGYFPAGTWTLSFPVIAVTGGGDQDGNVTARMFKATSGAFGLNDHYWVTYSSTLNLYAAVGTTGIIKTSVDGINWYDSYSTNTNALWNIEWGGGQFVAVGAGGTLLTSPDGINWTPQTSGTTNVIYGIAYGDGVWVYAATGGVVRSSTDGITWTSRTSGVAFDLYGVRWANGVFLAFGNSNATVIKSTNGTTWASKTLTGVAATIYFDDAAYGFFSTTPRWLLVGSSGWIAWSDDDGETWASSDTGNETALAATWDGSQFIIVGRTATTETGKINTLVFNTTNTYTKTERVSETVRFEGVVYNSTADLLVAVGDSNRVYTSSDGVTWTQRNLMTELTTAMLTGTTVTNLTTAAAQTSTVTWSAPAFFLNNEFLVCKLAWQITGAGGANGRDVLLRYGSGATMVSPSFRKRNYNIT